MNKKKIIISIAISILAISSLASLSYLLIDKSKKDYRRDDLSLLVGTYSKIQASDDYFYDVTIKDSKDNMYFDDKNLNSQDKDITTHPSSNSSLVSYKEYEGITFLDLSPLVKKITSGLGYKQYCQNKDTSPISIIVSIDDLYFNSTSFDLLDSGIYLFTLPNSEDDETVTYQHSYVYKEI